MQSTGIRICSSARSTPTCAKPRAPPPDSARPTRGRVPSGRFEPSSDGMAPTGATPGGTSVRTVGAMGAGCAPGAGCASAPPTDSATSPQSASAARTRRAIGTFRRHCGSFIGCFGTVSRGVGAWPSSYHGRSSRHAAARALPAPATPSRAETGDYDPSGARCPGAAAGSVVGARVTAKPQRRTVTQREVVHVDGWPGERRDHHKHGRGD